MTDNFNPTEGITTKEAAELTGYHNWEFYSRKDSPNNMLVAEGATDEDQSYC